MGELRRALVLVPVDSGGLWAAELGGVRWICAFTDEAALARFARARSLAPGSRADDATRTWDYAALRGARLLDEIVPALEGVRAALAGGGDWRALVREWTLPWGTGNDLAGIPLAGAGLGGVDLKDVILSYADLRGCDLTDAFLTGTDLREATLVNATLTRVNAGLCDLSGADLSGANADDAVFSRARLVGTRLSGASLRRVKFVAAELGDADFSDADLSDAVMVAARTAGTILDGARLEGTRHRSLRP
ncbi:pentapeptide repeat-containing protein [Streptomyces bikiniensis]|uniref:Pentapeptide repeat-containing protein n=1 Tax=Streptomyces bikiniensis TaxID=1896 RepID=A0ABW8CQH2_STRBI